VCPLFGPCYGFSTHCYHTRYRHTAHAWVTATPVLRGFAFTAFRDDTLRAGSHCRARAAPPSGLHGSCVTLPRYYAHRAAARHCCVHTAPRRILRCCHTHAPHLLLRCTSVYLLPVPFYITHARAATHHARALLPGWLRLLPFVRCRCVALRLRCTVPRTTLRSCTRLLRCCHLPRHRFADVAAFAFHVPAAVFAGIPPLPVLPSATRTHALRAGTLWTVALHARATARPRRSPLRCVAVAARTPQPGFTPVCRTVAVTVIRLPDDTDGLPQQLRRAAARYTAAPAACCHAPRCRHFHTPAATVPAPRCARTRFSTFALLPLPAVRRHTRLLRYYTTLVHTATHRTRCHTHIADLHTTRTPHTAILHRALPRAHATPGWLLPVGACRIVVGCCGSLYRGSISYGLVVTPRVTRWLPRWVVQFGYAHTLVRLV